MIKLNFCWCCYIYRAPRTSHCSECDNCIERFDHHCIWIGSCVGKRNYKSFIFFLIRLNLFSIYSIIFSSITVKKLFSSIGETNNLNEEVNTSYLYNDSTNIAKINKPTLMLVFSFICLIFTAIFTFVFTGKLMINHLLLCSDNITYYESIKNKFSNIPFGNPYFRGIYNNFTYLLCRSKPKNHLKIFLRKKEIKSDDFNSEISNKELSKKDINENMINNKINNDLVHHNLISKNKEIEYEFNLNLNNPNSHQTHNEELSINHDNNNLQDLSSTNRKIFSEDKISGNNKVLGIEKVISFKYDV